MRWATIVVLGTLVAAAPASADTPVVGGTSFNDATPVISGTYSDALDTGSTAYYGVELSAGQRLNVTTTLDMGGLDPSVAQTSTLLLSIYDPLREQTNGGGAEAVGPGDPVTHLKSTVAQIGPVKQAGLYYVTVGADDEANAPSQLPLGLKIAIGGSKAPAAPVRRDSSGGSGTTWAVFAALCAGGLVVGGGGGLLFRRR